MKCATSSAATSGNREERRDVKPKNVLINSSLCYSIRFVREFVVLFGECLHSFSGFFLSFDMDIWNEAIKQTNKNN